MDGDRVQARPRVGGLWKGCVGGHGPTAPTPSPDSRRQPEWGRRGSFLAQLKRFGFDLETH